MSATGTWNANMNTPMGAQSVVLNFTEEGSALTGNLSSPAVPGEQAISDGSVDGDSVAWKVEMTSPMPMTLEFTATIDGDSISGNVKLGTFGDATFEGTHG